VCRLGRAFSCALVRVGRAQNAGLRLGGEATRLGSLDRLRIRAPQPRAPESPVALGLLPIPAKSSTQLPDPISLVMPSSSTVRFLLGMLVTFTAEATGPARVVDVDQRLQARPAGCREVPEQRHGGPGALSLSGAPDRRTGVHQVSSHLEASGSRRGPRLLDTVTIVRER